MLKFLSGRKRSRNALLILFIIILTASLVGLFSVVVSGGGAGLFGGAGGSETTVAKVGSYTITIKEFKDRVASFAQQVAQGQGRAQGRQDLATTYATYGAQILDGLIGEKLVLYEADQLNLTASDAEVEQRLKQLFSPWQGPEPYRARLQSMGLTPVSFEDSLRASIAREHLRSYLTAAVQVAAKEVETDYQRTNSKYAARWVEVTADSLKDKVQVNDPDLRAYFDAHKDDFKITTEQRRARYIFIDANKAGESMQVSDDELKQAFDPERNLQQVRVSQIVLNVPKAADAGKPATRDAAAAAPDTKEDEVRKKAQSLADRAKATAGKAAEDFAKLAREASEDAKSKANGGDIGWVKKDDKRASDDPLNNAFTMKAGDVSQPIKKGDQYYILKVTDRRLATFAEAKPQLLKTARANKGYSEAVNIAKDEVEPKFKETKNAEAVIAEVNQKHGAAVASLKELPFFALGDALPELNAAPELETIVFDLENPGDVGERVNVPNGFAIVQYLDKRDPHDPTFEEVKAKVEQRYRSDKAKDLALERARQIAQAKTPDEMKKIADSFGIKTDERAGLAASDSIGPLNTDESREPVYKLKANEVGHEPLKTESGNSYVVVALTGRQDADMGEAFAKEKKSIAQRLLDERRNTYFNTYLKLLQKQLQDDGTIKVYQDRIATAMDSGGSQPGAVPQPPGIPGMPAPGRSGPRRTPPGAMRPQSK